MRWVDYCGHSLLLLFRHGIFFGSGRVGDKAWLDLIECHSVGRWRCSGSFRLLRPVAVPGDLCAYARLDVNSAYEIVCKLA